MFLIESGAFDCIKKIDGHSSYVSQRFFQFIHLFVYTLLPWFQVCVCWDLVNWFTRFWMPCSFLAIPKHLRFRQSREEMWSRHLGQGNRVQPDVPTMGAVNDVNGSWYVKHESSMKQWLEMDGDGWWLHFVIFVHVSSKCYCCLKEWSPIILKAAIIYHRSASFVIDYVYVPWIIMKWMKCWFIYNL